MSTEKKEIKKDGAIKKVVRRRTKKDSVASGIEHKEGANGKDAIPIRGVDNNNSPVDVLDKGTGDDDSDNKRRNDDGNTNTSSNNTTNGVGNNPDSEKGGNTREIEVDSIIDENVNSSIEDSVHIQNSQGHSDEIAGEGKTGKVIIKQEPAVATKRRGRKPKTDEEKARDKVAREKKRKAQKMINNPMNGATIIPLVDVVAVQGIAYGVKKMLNKNIDPRGLLMTKDERESLEPLVDAVMEKYFNGSEADPAIVLLSGMAAIYAGKLMG